MRVQRIVPNVLAAAIRAALGQYTPSIVRLRMQDGTLRTLMI